MKGLLLLACLLPGRVEAGVAASGTLKTLYDYTRSPLTRQAQWGDLSRARLSLKAEHGLGVPGRTLRASVDYDHELRVGTRLKSLESRTFGLAEPDSFLTMDQTISSGTDAAYRHRLYRGWVELADGPWTARFGRQRIAWGTGKIWNPADVLNPYQPTALERDERPGVDALHVRRGLGTLGQGEAVYGLGRSWAETDLLTRARGNISGSDLALLGGKLSGSTGSWLAGGEASVDLGGGSVHAECTYTDLELRTPFWRGLLGYEYSFSSSPPWAPLKDVWLAAEWFHNGRGRRDAARYDAGLLRSGREVALAQDYLGVALKKELHPLLSAELSLLQNLNDASRFISPSLDWNPWGDLHLAAGWQSFAGTPRSEYGRLANIAFAQAQLFF